MNNTLTIIRQLRQEHGVTQQQLADYAEVHVQTVKDHEARKYAPGGRVLVAYARRFGLEPADKWAIAVKIAHDYA